MIDIAHMHDVGGNTMNSYYDYMESLLELKNQEIELYKNFIERELKCRISDEVIRTVDTSHANFGQEVEYRLITIPESRYMVRGSRW